MPPVLLRHSLALKFAPVGADKSVLFTNARRFVVNVREGYWELSLTRNGELGILGLSGVNSHFRP
jgi:hypothetical protein